jgi:hypothetical protein
MTLRLTNATEKFAPDLATDHDFDARFNAEAAPSEFWEHV